MIVLQFDAVYLRWGHAPPAAKDGIYRRFLAEHERQRAGEAAA